MERPPPIAPPRVCVRWRGRSSEKESLSTVSSPRSRGVARVSGGAEDDNRAARGARRSEFTLLSPHKINESQSKQISSFVCTTIMIMCIVRTSFTDALELS